MEYAYNTIEGTVLGTAYTNTSFVQYGPAGGQFPGITSKDTTFGHTSYIVQFQSPIQVGDKIVLEYSTNSGATWLDASTNFEVQPFTQSTVALGMDWIPNSSNSILVRFGRGGREAPATYPAVGGATWNTLATVTARKWRVRKSSAGAAVGFGIVAPGVSSGLVSASGLPGNTTGNAIASGYVGEVITATGSQQTLTTGQFNDGGVAVQTLQPGIWAVYAGGYFNTSSASTVVVRNLVGIGTATGNSSSGMVIPSETTSCPGSTGGQPNMITAPPAIKVLSVATQFYVKVYSDFSVAGQTGLGYFRAIRIA